MYFFLIKIEKIRPSLVAQWFRLWSSTTGGTGLTPGWGTKIPPQKNEKKKKKKSPIFLHEMNVLCYEPKDYSIIYVFYKML